MTMQNLPHPDDERLAAYAGADPDALADASLAAHLSTCDRCRPLVDELSLLRGFLAELPDLAPSRPLRLIPPVSASAAPIGIGAWLRRLTGPAMAAGAGLVLVGAIGVGATGALGGLFGQAASAMFQNVGDNLEAAGGSTRDLSASRVPAPGAAGSPLATSGETKGSSDSAGLGESPTARGSSEASPSAAPGGTDGHLQDGTDRQSPEQPWLTLLIAGAGIFVIATALRFSISPRAG